MRKKNLGLFRIFSGHVNGANKRSPMCKRPAAAKKPRWYAAVSGSAVFLQDTDITHSEPGYPLSDGQTFHIGYGFSGAIGYRIFPNIRGELEGVFRRNEVDKTTANGIIGPAGGTVRQSSYAFMTNAYYDLHNSSRFTPYVGAGIGPAHVSNPRVIGTTANHTKNIEGWVLAYQFMTGINYEIHTSLTPMELTLGYRYFTGEDVDTTLGPLAPGKHGVNNDSHNIELGGKVFFKRISSPVASWLRVS